MGTETENPHPSRFTPLPPRILPAHRYDPAPVAWARIARRMSDLSGFEVTCGTYGFTANLGGRRIGPMGLYDTRCFLGIDSVAT
jgi:hypothetical protein